jgi:HSP20 family molecular chaperone IbpA
MLLETKLAFNLSPTLTSATPSFINGRDAEELELAIYERIRERAYQLFEQSGREPGNESANWLRAESEIVRSGVEVRESGSWVTLTASIPDGTGLGMQIVIRPTRVVVRTTDACNGRDSTESAQRSGREIFLAANLDAEVDPASATASFKNHRLHLMVKKRRVGKPTGF